MSLNPETITQIQTLLQTDPALLEQLQTETELAGVAAVITKAATAQGLDINEADLVSHLAAEQSQAGATTLSDAELEQVAGGFARLDLLRKLPSEVDAPLDAPGPVDTRLTYEGLRKLFRNSPYSSSM